MKILCDVCGKEEALVFCCADEAAVCDSCDLRVHHANKLAGKHPRFSLSAASAQSHPVCDICKEKRGFLFCQQDRAILCRDCDAPIHSANHLTMKHNRFLLTGVRLSSRPISSSLAAETEEVTAKADTNNMIAPSSNTAPTASTSTSITTCYRVGAATAFQNETLVASTAFPTTSSAISATNNSNSSTGSAAAAITTSNGSASSISEYLIKMCPGWRVEDLLMDDSAAAMDGFSKVDELLPFLEADMDSGWLEAAAPDLPIWAPHVSQFPPVGLSTPGGVSAGHYLPWMGGKGAGLSYHQGGKAGAGRQQWSEDALMVPQISSPASSTSRNSKRTRNSLWYN